MYIDYFIIALKNIFLPVSLLAISIGVTLGIIAGALPGISTQMAIILLLPLTFGLDPKIGLPMLMAVYCGGMFGGSISAILFHTPGTPAAAATCLDGYPMARKGQGGRAIGFALVASFIGGTFSAVVLFFVAPPLARIALIFGPPEYFALGLLGLSLIGTLVQENWIKGLLSGIIGLLISIVGSDLITGNSRFTFGHIELLTGIPLVILVIGLFSISQVLVIMEEKIEKKSLEKLSGRIFPTFEELKKLIYTILRSSIIGTWVGIVPGTGGDLASWASYNEAKRNSKTPELFGTGIPEGVVAPEAANNAVTGGALVPLLTLGIPGSAATAILLGGFFIHGLRPGPSFITENGELAYTLMLSLFIANLMVLIIGSIIGKGCRYIINVKDELIVPFIVILCVVGAYAINNSMFDVGLMFIFGLFGYAMKKLNFPAAPMVLGLILGPLTENGLVQSLLISRGSWLIFISRPFSLILLSIAIFSLINAIYKDSTKYKVKSLKNK